ncbi:MAG: adenylyltransferase/cytidyltransferase family protein [Gammaproteobacteria bacterium]|nr:adenylyltransferase/cytidyltransferase family protein [Gammaproteobacteria bacterium]NKB64983.1 adenylyltransferase/cytidyltransferase family protein [Gammaproteobacteria bacterium]
MSVFTGESDASIIQWAASLPRPLVFTNGCFDILHLGHVSYLQTAAELGAGLVVGVNTDQSVRWLEKGNDRPINPLIDRMGVLAALGCVNGVISFDQPTPLNLINLIRPDHLVKGGDWALEDIVGGREVKSWGGNVHSIEFEHQRSTTDLLNRIRSLGSIS